ncbi:hypothetical protein H0H93_013423 [Arthromyces matolae]|nr:hypothetical protein H0H93_013423 [Arthromyces matolae]
MLFTALPNDVFILVLQYLDVNELVTLSICCKLLKCLIADYGWTAYLRAHPRPSYSLALSRKNWSKHAQIYYDFLTDRSWRRSEFVARPLSKPWPEKSQPILAISSSRLVVAAGSGITCFTFGESGDRSAPSLSLEGTFSFAQDFERPSSITSMTFVDDGGADETLCLGFHNGVVQYVSLKHSATLVLSSCQLQNGDYLENLTSDRDLILAFSSTGVATLTNLHSGLPELHSIKLNARGWASYFCLDSTGPYAAFGTSSIHPLKVHSLRNDQLSQVPTAILHPYSISGVAGLKPISSAVYGISRGPLASPWGASPQILVSGWFDGQDLPVTASSLFGTFAPQALAGVFTLLAMTDPPSMMSSLKAQGYMALHKADLSSMTSALASLQRPIRNSHKDGTSTD